MTQHKDFTKTPKELSDARYAAVLTAAGYRRISNKFRLISRIDNAQWVELLAEQMHCAPADFFVAGKGRTPSASWCDHYRRCFSKDMAEVSPAVFQLIPGSGYDDCGYVGPEDISTHSHKEPDMATPPRPIPPTPASPEVKLFNAIEELTRTLGVTTQQVRTCCNVLDMLQKKDFRGGE